MEINEVVEKLSKQFISRYGKRFAELNKNVYPAAKTDSGAYEVPVPTLSAGGGTLVTGVGDDAFQLEPAARVKVELKNMKAQMLIYRIAIPYSECEIAAKTPEYFNYLFDAIISKALGNYEKTVGGPDRVRFGESYCMYKADRVFIVNDDHLELRLSGSWASDLEDYT